MQSLEGLRKMIVPAQRAMVDAFWQEFVRTNEWPLVCVVHSQHEKANVRAKLGPLGGSIVMESEDHHEGARYRLTVLGILLTSEGADLLSLLVAHFSELRDVFYRDPRRKQVSDQELKEALKIDDARLGLLSKLLNSHPLFLRIGDSPWQAKIPEWIDDLPRNGAINELIEQRLLKDYSRASAVFVDQRQRQLMATPPLSGLFEAAAVPAQGAAPDRSRRRFQVFVSSTYDDLKEVRQHVMQALLEMRCIPTGMELFPAASIDQWELIKGVIDECDYYMVIVGGRYGSMDENGISYTEREYDYAMESGKPIIGFTHAAPRTLPADKTDENDAARAKLAGFTEKVRKKPCRSWRDGVDLGSAVKTAIVSEMDLNPRPGWIRADHTPSVEGLERLKRRITDLEEKLSAERARSRGSLASENKEIEIPVEARALGPKEKMPFEGTRSRILRRSLEEILLVFADSLQTRTNESMLRMELEHYLSRQMAAVLKPECGELDPDQLQTNVPGEFFHRLLHSLVARNWVKVDLPGRNDYGEKTLQLTPSGIRRVAELRTL